MDKLTNFLSFFAALTLATERITETIKGLPLLSRWLAVEKPSGSTAEEFRKASIHILAMAVATALTYLTRDQISSLTGMHYQGTWTYLLFGAVASGGSAMLNSVLDILSEVNHQKQLATQQLKLNPSTVLPQLADVTTPPTPTAPAGNVNAVNQERQLATQQVSSSPSAAVPELTTPTGLAFAVAASAGNVNAVKQEGQLATQQVSSSPSAAVPKVTTPTGLAFAVAASAGIVNAVKQEGQLATQQVSSSPSAAVPEVTPPTGLAFAAAASAAGNVNAVNQERALATPQVSSSPPATLSEVTAPTGPPSAAAAPADNGNQQVVAVLPKSNATRAISPVSIPAPRGPSTPTATGDRLLQLARQHVGEKYVLSVRVPKDNFNWKGPWNCSEFVSWLVFQVAGRLYGCDNDKGDPAIAHAFTGYWNRDAQSQGQIISIEQAARTPGAAVLRLPQPAAMGHIVISDGQNGTVEARSPNDGVIPFTLNGRRWDLAILIHGIAYSEGAIVPVSPPSTTIYRLKEPMMTGIKVEEIQEKLKAAGCDPGPLDGEFGPYTHAAVVAFQSLYGLVPDGEVGPQTAAALGIHL
jgi:mRNA-degrading endonuclease toxin of MazEF toxin-antitoxin module